MVALNQHILKANLMEIPVEVEETVKSITLKNVGEITTPIKEKRHIVKVETTSNKGFALAVVTLMKENMRGDYPYVAVLPAKIILDEATKAKAYESYGDYVQIRDCGGAAKDVMEKVYDQVNWETIAIIDFVENEKKMAAYQALQEETKQLLDFAESLPVLENIEQTLPKYGEYQELSKDLFSLYNACFNGRNEIKNRMYMCNPNPSFQRDFVWADEMKVALIESIISGIPIGTFYVNMNHYHDVEILGEGYGETLWEGKQRIHAIHDFIYGKFPVPINGQNVYYAQAPTYFNRAIRGCRINVMQSEYRSLEDIIKAYVRVNQNKVAHKDEDYEKAIAYLKAKKKKAE